jgi:hypothetical protein
MYHPRWLGEELYIPADQKRFEGWAGPVIYKRMSNACNLLSKSYQCITLVEGKHCIILRTKNKGRPVRTTLMFLNAVCSYFESTGICLLIDSSREISVSVRIMPGMA